jgi:hypothetical protein
MEWMLDTNKPKRDLEVNLKNRGIRVPALDGGSQSINARAPMLMSTITIWRSTVELRFIMAL